MLSCVPRLTQRIWDLSAILQQTTRRLVVNVYTIVTGANRRRTLARTDTGRRTDARESFLLHAASLWSTPGIKAYQRTDSARAPSGKTKEGKRFQTHGL